jgi:phosphoribosyl-AMP cyclohydrolase
VTGEHSPPEAAPTPGYRGRPLEVDEALLAEVRFGENGLVPVVVQDRASRIVLMVAYMDREALRRTIESGRSWFYSRSRKEYWQKGETSGNRQWVREIRLDCDRDAVLLLVDQEGIGACHNDTFSCFTAPLAG